MLGIVGDLLVNDLADVLLVGQQVVDGPPFPRSAAEGLSSPRGVRFGT